MTRTPRALAPLLAIVLHASATPLRAQIRASERAIVSQTIDGTKLTVNYARPRARGRDTLFGSARAVHWGEVWTPGANMATTLDVSRDIRLAGLPVKKGTYSVWMTVRPGSEWTFILDPEPKRYHMAPPDSSAGQLRAPVKVERAPFIEVLTWSFPDIRANGGTLAMQWGTSRVALDVTVEPSLRTELPESEAAPYLGRYDYTKTGRGGEVTRSTFIVSYENGTLKGEWDPMDRYMKRFALIRIAPDWFAPGVYDEHGVLYEVYRPEETFEFTRQGGRAVTLEVRGEDDKVFATAKRK